MRKISRDFGRRNPKRIKKIFVRTQKLNLVRRDEIDFKRLIVA
jgi:hypothetical protein